MVVSASVGLVIGLVLGWYVRSARQSSATRLLDELYTRKVRLAESDRDVAVRTLNENRVLMATFDERFAALDAEIEKAVGEREAARALQRTAEEDAARRVNEIDNLREALARATQFADEALQESSQASKEREVALDAAEAARAHSEIREREAAGLEDRLRAQSEAYEALRHELEDERARRERAEAVQTELARELERTGGELERARARILELEPLREALQAVQVELAAREQRLTIAEGAVAALGARTVELEPYPERLRAAHEQLTAAREQHTRSQAELEQAWRERLDSERTDRAHDVDALLARIAALEPFEPRARELATRVAELEPLSQQLAVESQRSDELAHDLQVQRAAAFQLDSRCTQLTRDIEHVHAALDEAARSLAASNARAEQLERELSTERASIQQLEARLAEQRDSEAAARREAATSAAHAAHSTKRADALDLRLERDRAKLEEAGQRENALSQQLAQVRSERSDLTKQLAALGASHRAKQLELDRRAVRIDELRAAVKERDARLRELAVQLKASAAEKRRVDGRRGAATASSVGDDLTRIAGIGPALERKLHHLGLKTFRQIARLSRTEIVRIAEQLGTTPERIQRDGWIAAARGALRTKGA